MFKLASCVAAMALLAGAPAFAQGANDGAATSTDANKASGNPGREHHHHHMRHHPNGDEANSGRTDMDAEKLNACWASANPTSAQEDCLRHASRS